MNRRSGLPSNKIPSIKKNTDLSTTRESELAQSNRIKSAKVSLVEGPADQGKPLASAEFETGAFKNKLRASLL